MTMATAVTQVIDRKLTVPFHLKIFYKTGTFHRLDEFQSSNSSLPPHINISTWPNCTLRELSHHIASNLPDLLPSPPIGTRLIFRLVFPDTKFSHSHSQGPGRYMTKELGAIVIGSGLPSSSKSAIKSNNENIKPPNNNEDVGDGSEGGKYGNGDWESLTESQKEFVRGGLLEGDCGGTPEKSLQDARFVIGDFIDCAIIPPLSNGDIAPNPEPSINSPYNNSGPTHVYSLSGAGGRGGHVRNGSGGGGGPNEFIHPSRAGRVGGGGVGGGGGGSWRSGQQGDFGAGRNGVLGASRDNGYGGFRASNGGMGGGFRGGGGSRGAGNVGYGRDEVPVGEWRRGERVPDGGPPRGGRDYGYGRGGRGSGRW